MLACAADDKAYGSANTAFDQAEYGDHGSDLDSLVAVYGQLDWSSVLSS